MGLFFARRPFIILGMRTSAQRNGERHGEQIMREMARLRQQREWMQNDWKSEISRKARAIAAAKAVR